MASGSEPLDQRLRNGTTWYIIQSQSEWWRTRSVREGWVRRRDMRLAHKLHTLGWLEDHASDILSDAAKRLYQESKDSLFGNDLIAEADYLEDMAASEDSAHLAVRGTRFYQRLLFDINDRLGSGYK